MFAATYLRVGTALEYTFFHHSLFERMPRSCRAPTGLNAVVPPTRTRAAIECILYTRVWGYEKIAGTRTVTNSAADDDDNNNDNRAPRFPRYRFRRKKQHWYVSVKRWAGRALLLLLLLFLTDRVKFIVYVKT